MSSCSMPGQVRRVFKDAGRVCPVDYRIPADAFAGEPADACDVLYVVGGLYGNPFALDALDALVGQERGSVRVVLNGDAHWFDKTAENFATLERRMARYTPLVGNVEAELRRQVDVGVGCGCAYPDCTGDDAVSRSNRIHKKLSEAVDAHPELKGLLVGRQATATVRVAGKKVAVTHGDERLVGGWACSRESLQDVLRQDELDCWMADNGVDVLATTHTCAPAALSLARGLVVNNGAAGLPNFAGQRFGLVVRVAATPHPDALFGAERDGVHVEAVPLRYDHDAFLAWFDGLWEATSPAAVSYRSRIVDGPDDRLEDSLLGGFTRGPAARVEAPPRRARATKEDVELALAKLVYFEDVMDDDACLRTVDEPSTIQVNVGARCNLACAHCHVEAGPHRTEAMDRATFEAVLAVAARPGIDTVDVTGGAPEMNPHFAWFIEQGFPGRARYGAYEPRHPARPVLRPRSSTATPSWAWRWWPRCRTSTPRRPSNSAATRRSIPPSRCCASSTPAATAATARTCSTSCSIPSGLCCRPTRTSWRTCTGAAWPSWACRSTICSRWPTTPSAATGRTSSTRANSTRTSTCSSTVSTRRRAPA